ERARSPHGGAPRGPRDASAARCRFRLVSMIAAIVLAAGFARRMGRQKLLLELRGKPVVRWSVEAILPHVADTVVVTGQDDQALRSALAGLPVRFARVDIDAPMPLDVDTPEDYARLHVQ